MKRAAYTPMLISALCIFTSLVGCVDVDSAPVAPAAATLGGDSVPDTGIAGYWDDVAFSKADVQIVLAFANQATLEQLDIDAKLDVRAARSIINAQPIASMGHLSTLHFVGASTLARLKAAALQDHAARTVVCAEPQPLFLIVG